MRTIAVPLAPFLAAAEGLASLGEALFDRGGVGGVPSRSATRRSRLRGTIGQSIGWSEQYESQKRYSWYLPALLGSE